MTRRSAAFRRWSTGRPRSRGATTLRPFDESPLRTPRAPRRRPLQTRRARGPRAAPDGRFEAALPHLDRLRPDRLAPRRSPPRWSSRRPRRSARPPRSPSPARRPRTRFRRFLRRVRAPRRELPRSAPSRLTAGLRAGRSWARCSLSRSCSSRSARRSRSRAGRRPRTRSRPRRPRETSRCSTTAERRGAVDAGAVAVRQRRDASFPWVAGDIDGGHATRRASPTRSRGQRIARSFER